MVMPLLFSLFAVSLGLGDALGLAGGDARGRGTCACWRGSPTSSSPRTRRSATSPSCGPGHLPPCDRRGATSGSPRATRRVWALFVLYGACFGVELTMDNVAALYYADHFGLGLKAAGIAAGSLGLMHLFARTLGGAVSDRIGGRWGLKGGFTGCSSPCCARESA